MIKIKHLLTKSVGTRTLVWAVAQSSIRYQYSKNIVLWGTAEDGMASRRMTNYNNQLEKIVGKKIQSGYRNSDDTELAAKVRELFEKHDFWEQLSGQDTLTKHKTTFDK